MQPSSADQANQLMVDRLIAEGALWSPRLIAAFRDTPRHCFLDRIFHCLRKTGRWREIITRDPGPDELKMIYCDRALTTRLSPSQSPEETQLPISSSSQPSLMAQMLEDLCLAPGQRVLEIGAGTGYNAALLAHAVQPGLVVAIDVDREVLSEAWDHLRRIPGPQVEFNHADGRLGFPEQAPYDRIAVTAATSELEPAWLDQLAPDGLVQAPLNIAPGLAFLVQGTVRGGIFQGQLTRAAYFMPLRSEHEPGTPDYESPRQTDTLQIIPAPWANWFDGRFHRGQWPTFIQSLTFFAWLHGLAIHYQGHTGDNLSYGISQPPHNNLCWFGWQEWQIAGAQGRDLGWSLWRAFLDAGGPWPIEYLFQADPQARLKPQGKYSFLKQGPMCQHLWQLMPMRKRPGWI